MDLNVLPVAEMLMKNLRTLFLWDTRYSLMARYW